MYACLQVSRAYHTPDIAVHLCMHVEYRTFLVLYSATVTMCGYAPTQVSIIHAYMAGPEA